MRAFTARRGAVPEELIGRLLCHDVGTLPKGHPIRADDVPRLFARQDSIHILTLDDDDLGQTVAGERLVQAVQGPGLLALPIRHRYVLRATEDGLLEVDGGALQRINEVDGVVVFTPRSGEVVGAGDVVAHAQITRLAIARSKIEEVERIAREQPILRLRPFVGRDAILWRRDDRFVNGVAARLRRYGCRLKQTVRLADDVDAIRRSFEAFLDSGAKLYLICGANALDPLDPVLIALEQLGAVMCCSGIPVHPGTLLWVATLRDVTIVGFPPCGLRGEVSAFDLVLPRLLVHDASEGLSLEELAALGHGGLLSRARPHSFAEEEAVDDAVR